MIYKNSAFSKEDIDNACEENISEEEFHGMIKTRLLSVLMFHLFFAFGIICTICVIWLLCLIPNWEIYISILLSFYFSIGLFPILIIFFIRLFRTKHYVTKKLKQKSTNELISSYIENNLSVLSTVMDFQDKENTKFYIDNENNVFIIKQNDYVSTVFNLSNLIYFDIFENGKNIKDHNYKFTCRSLELKIRLSNLDIPEITLTYIDSKCKKKGKKYQRIIKNLHHSTSLLENIIIYNNNKRKQITVDKTETTGTVEQRLAQLKEIFLADLITAEEYETKKTQILFDI